MNRTAWMILSLAATMLLGMLSGPADTKATTEPATVAETRIEATVSDAIKQLRTELSQLRTQFSAEQLSRAIKDAEPAIEDSSQWSMIDPEWSEIEGTAEATDTKFVALNGQCTSGSCNGANGVVYASRSSGASRWYPGKRLISAARSRRSAGNGWYPGKNLGRLFGRRR